MGFEKKIYAAIAFFALLSSTSAASTVSQTKTASAQIQLTGVSIEAGGSPGVILRFSRDPAYQAYQSGPVQIRFFGVMNGGAPSNLNLRGRTAQFRQDGSDLVVSGLNGVTLRFFRGKQTMTILTMPTSKVQAAYARFRAQSNRRPSLSRTVMTPPFFLGEAARLLSPERHRHTDGREYPNEPFKVLSQSIGPKIATNPLSNGNTVTVQVIAHGALPFDTFVATRIRALTFDSVTGALLGEVDTLATDPQAQSAGFPQNHLGGQ